MANEERLIDRWALFPNGVFFVNEKNPMASLDALINRIFSAPTVDAVEVVRCKDCKHGSPFVTDRKNEVWCCKMLVYAPVDGFCSYGERKERGKMNNFFIPNKDFVESMKKRFPAGIRIELDCMGDDPRPIPPGTKGVVRLVDDIGTVHCTFDNGRRLGLIPGEDSFHVIEEEK